MTMTLRCTHCDQTMSIAPRKPGSRVTCPACGRTVTVPEPELPNAPAAAAVRESVSPASGPSSPAPAHARVERGAALATAAPPPRVASTSPTPAAAARAAHSRKLVASFETTDSPETQRVDGGGVPVLPLDRTAARSVVLPNSVAILAILLALAALALAFAAGFLFGRSAPASRTSGEQSAVTAIERPVML